VTTLTITLTNEQVMDLVSQLPLRQKRELFVQLARNEWPAWARIAGEGEAQARRLAAERGLEWNVLSDEERITLVDDLLHESRS